MSDKKMNEVEQEKFNLILKKNPWEKHNHGYTGDEIKTKRRNYIEDVLKKNPHIL